MITYAIAMKIDKIPPMIPNIKTKLTTGSCIALRKFPNPVPTSVRVVEISVVIFSRYEFIQKLKSSNASRAQGTEFFTSIETDKVLR